MEGKSIAPIMNPGDGENSYARNSGVQKAMILAALPIVDDSLKLMFAGGDDGFPRCLRIVDLGCSSGPNTLFAISHVLETIEGLYSKSNTGFDNLPEFEVFLNDLSDNDFNNLFKLLPSFSNQVHGKEKRKCFWYGLPGSFYDRLFPTNSLHLAFASSSLHWLSQIPEGLANKNKENIYITRTSPPEVIEAYAKQYQRDFSTFLRLRSREIVHGGRMLVILAGRRVEGYWCEDDSAHFTLLSQTLLDMEAEGHVKMDDLHSFNVPVYHPCEKEVETVILDEGSFDLYKLQVVPVRWDAIGDTNSDDDELLFDKHRSGKLMADRVRAPMEPMLVSHFGNSINVDEVFARYADKVAEYLSVHQTSVWNTLISLCRR